MLRETKRQQQLFIILFWGIKTPKDFLPTQKLLKTKTNDS